MTREEAITVLNMVEAHGLADEAKRVAIEALSERTGEWINREYCQVDEDAYEIATCSHCKAEITLEYPNDNFCPNCGADMRGGKA